MKKLPYFLLAALLVVISGCEKDDFTGDSKMSPSSPSISVTGAPVGANLVEQDKTYTFTVSLSEPQTVDVSIYISKSAGTATEGEDFTIDNGNSRVFIPAGRTTGTVSISIKPDEIVEETETLTIQVGDGRTGNASITPVFVSFTITNVTENDLALGLEWDSEVYDAHGEELNPTSVADMIFWITDSEGVVLEESDGGSFESLVFSGEYPDGTYYVKAGIYDVIDLGGLGDPPILDLNLSYSQVGKIDLDHESYPKSYNTAFNCSGNIYTMAKVEKTGSDYVVSRYVSSTLEPIQPGNYTATLDPSMAGYWFGISSAQRTVSVTKLSDNTWSVTDITAGAYNACCGLQLNQAAVIKLDYCTGEITIESETGSDVSGQGKQPGSFNSLTGTFTVHFNDIYGSAGDANADLFTTFVKQP